MLANHWTNASLERLLDDLRRMSDSVYACSFSYAWHDDAWTRTDLHTAGTHNQNTSSQVAHVIERMSPASWTPEVPARLDLKARFYNLAQARLSPTRRRQLTQHLADQGLGDIARVVLYEGVHLLGCVGLLRGSEQPSFTVTELKRLSESLGDLREQLRSLASSEEWEEPAQLVLSDKGDDLMTQESTAWLTPTRRAMLLSMLSRLNRSDSVTFIAGGARIKASGLITSHASAPRCALFTIDKVVRPRLNPLARLTPRQRQVAEYAAVGATSSEIARTLDIKTETVRDHIKTIYKRLQLNSRVELSALLRSDPHMRT